MATIDILINGSLAIIMLGIGMSIRLKEFKTIFIQPRALTIGLLLQMIFLPLVFGTIIWFAPIPSIFKFGFFIVGLCPGGTASNFISYILRANTALSISMTTINSFLILLSLPLLTKVGMTVFLAENQEFQLSLWQTVRSVLLIIMIPVLLGMSLRQLFGDSLEGFNRYMRIVNISLFALVYGIKFFAPEESGGSGMSISTIMALLPTALTLHFISMIAAFLIARLLKLKSKSSVTIGIEVGLQNTTLALLICTTMLMNEQMGQPALVYAMFSFFTTLAFGWIGLRRTNLKSIDKE